MYIDSNLKEPEYRELKRRWN